MNSWKAFSSSLLVVETFSLQKVVKILEKVVVGERSGDYSGWGKTSYPNLFNFCCYGEELGPFCWPVLAAGIAVPSASHRFASILLRCKGLVGNQEAVVDQTGSQPPNRDHDLFWCKFVFEKCFGASSQLNHLASHRWFFFFFFFSFF